MSANTQALQYKIGEVTAKTGFSTDTLRYYEKAGLLKKVARAASGVRLYSDKDLSRLRFIQRAKTMNFSLDEIAQLLQMRENPAKVRRSVRELTQHKLDQVETHLQTLITLRNELTLLVNMCTGAKEGCPIIDEIDQSKKNAR